MTYEAQSKMLLFVSYESWHSLFNSTSRRSHVSYSGFWSVLSYFVQIHFRVLFWLSTVKIEDIMIQILISLLALLLFNMETTALQCSLKCSIKTYCHRQLKRKNVNLFWEEMCEIFIVKPLSICGHRYHIHFEQSLIVFFKISYIYSTSYGQWLAIAMELNSREMEKSFSYGHSKSLSSVSLSQQV